MVAELSANHNQDLNVAMKTIEAIKETGADAVKLQTYRPDTITIDCKSDIFRKKDGLWKGNTLYQIYERGYTPWDWQPKLKEFAEDIGLICFSSPFDKTSVDFLEKMGVPAYKIASLEITDIPLIEYAASKGKPVIMSTGVARLGDIEEAVDACKRQGNEKIVLLKCTSAYPAPYEEMNLRTIPSMAEIFHCPVGLSDHTRGISVPVASVALGAKMIEKHFVLDRGLHTLDAAFSLEPKEFKEMVSSIREVEKAMGEVDFRLTEKAGNSRKNRRSLFVVKDMRKGEVFSERNVRSVRPGHGLHPRYLIDVFGRRAKRDIKFETPLNWYLVG